MSSVRGDVKSSDVSAGVWRRLCVDGAADVNRHVFSLSNQTASTQMQLQGIHLVRMADPVLSAQFGGIKSNLKSRFSNNKHSKNVIHTSASPCWGWTLMGTRFLPSFHPQSRGGSRVSTAFPICELYIHIHTRTLSCVHMLDTEQTGSCSRTRLLSTPWSLGRS